MAKKQAKGRRQTNRDDRRRRLKHEIKSQLHAAWQRTQQGRWHDAVQLLEQLDQRYPDQPDVLQRLAEVYPRIGRVDQAQQVATRLLEMNHESADLLVLMAGACLTNLRLATGLAYFERFVERWPNDPRAEHARQTMSELNAEIARSAARAGVPSEEARQLAVDHETILDLLAAHKLVEVEDLARRLHERYPAFAPAGNNLADALFYQDRRDESLAVAHEVLEQNPANAYTLAIIICRLCAWGRCAEAQSYAERLRAVAAKSPDSLLKQMEALSYLGDDAGVLDTWTELEPKTELASQTTLAFGHHLAAVASLRLGQEVEARRHWREAQDLDPESELIRGNWEDFEKPLGNREGPWPFEVARWLSRRAIIAYDDQVLSTGDESGEDQFQRRQRYLAQHPEMEALVPVLLDRGDPPARAFSLNFAINNDTPALRQALQEFARGQRGSDEQRIRAAEHLSQVGILDAQRVRMWVKGEQREVVLQQFELHGEASLVGNSEADELAHEAYEALMQDDGARAEALLKRAIELVPDQPSLHKNLANAYKVQDREEEAIEESKWVRQRFPDYLFGRVQFAHIYISEGKLDLADAELAPLRDRRRLHFTEFSARMLAEVRLADARRDKAAAGAWLDFWERMLPDDPQLDIARRLLDRSSFSRSLLTW